MAQLRQDYEKIKVYFDETFGESAFFRKSDAPVYAQAMAPSRLLVLDSETVCNAIKQWPDLSLSFLELAHARTLAERQVQNEHHQGFLFVAVADEHRTATGDPA